MEIRMFTIPTLPCYKSDSETITISKYVSSQKQDNKFSYIGIFIGGIFGFIFGNIINPIFGGVIGFFGGIILGALLEH